MGNISKDHFKWKFYQYLASSIYCGMKIQICAHEELFKGSMMS